MRSKLNRFLSALMAFLLILSLAPIAHASNKTDEVTVTSLNDDKSLLLKQSGSGPCVYYSCYMMALRKMRIDGIGTSAASLSKFKNVATNGSDSVYNSFTYTFGSSNYEYNFRRIQTYQYSSNWHYEPILRKGAADDKYLANSADMKRLLIQQLSVHPEGVVVFRWNDNDLDNVQHAVLVTDYSKSDGLFYCNDPATGTHRRLSNTELAHGSSSSVALKRQDYALQRISSLWVIYSANNLPTKSFVVKYDAHGGEGYMPDETFQNGTAATLSPCTFTREGYAFTGWLAERRFDTTWRCINNADGYRIYYGSTLKKNAPTVFWAAKRVISSVGAERKLYADRASIKDITKVDGGSVTFYAMWEPVEAPADTDAPVLNSISIDSTCSYGTACVAPCSTMTLLANIDEASSFYCDITAYHAVSGNVVNITGENVSASANPLYELSFTLPSDMTPGTWVISELSITDSAGNQLQVGIDDDLPNLWFAVDSSGAAPGICSLCIDDAALSVDLQLCCTNAFLSALGQHGAWSLYGLAASYDQSGKLISAPIPFTFNAGNTITELSVPISDKTASVQIFLMGSSYQPLSQSIVLDMAEC